MNGLLIIACFVLVAVFMASRVLPTLLALPLLATAMAFCAGISLQTYFNVILLQGPLLLGSAMVVVVLGALFARVMQRTGISDSIIRTAAELSGDNPFTLAFLLWLATVLVFMGMSGLGAIVMVGTIVLPLLTGAGIAPVKAVCLVLLGMQVGLSLNTSFYATFMGIFGGEIALAYLLPVVVIGVAGSLLFLVLNVPGAGLGPVISSLVTISQAVVGLPLALWRRFSQVQASNNGLIIQPSQVPALAYAAPVVPILVVLTVKFTYGFQIQAGGLAPMAVAMLGFVVASLFAVLLTKPRQLLDIFAGAVVEGIRDVAGVIFLFMGIGMLALTVLQPETKSCLLPLLEAVLPESVVGILAFFVVLAPAALYRGPLNMFGMGSGLAAVLVALGKIDAAALCGIFLAVAYVQTLCDPTNSHNTWLADYAGVDTNQVLQQLLPYAWGMCLVLAIYVACWH